MMLDKNTLKSLGDSDKLNGLIDITWAIDEKLTNQFPFCRNRFVQKKHVIIGLIAFAIGYGGLEWRKIFQFLGLL